MGKVVNLRHEKCDIKICRTKDNKIPKAPLPGCFGNPVFLKDVNDDVERAEVIRKYKIYFLEKVDSDPDFRAAVLALRGKTLGCFCKPKDCHGDVIIEWLESHEKESIENRL